MLGNNHGRSAGAIGAVMLMILAMLPAGRAEAYIDLAPTLGKIISDSRTIALVEVVEYQPAQHIVILKKTRLIKGEMPEEIVKHDVSSEPGAAAPRPIAQWATPGARGVLFSSRNSALVCMGQGWYPVRNSDNGGWTLGAERPDLPLAYYGTVSRLTDAIPKILRNESAVITAVAFGAEEERAAFDLALNRHDVPGMVQLQRLYASLSMPSTVAAASANPTYLLGSGPVGVEDITTLEDQLRSPDMLVRAEAADDLGTLGRKARSVVPALEELLSSTNARVRFAAAAAVLRIAGKHPRATGVLSVGFDNADFNVRLEATRALGRAGPEGKSLVYKLGILLEDPSEVMRTSAVLSASLLGRAAAELADNLIPLLDDKNLAIDAADALGRMGSAAKDALPKLSRMLSSPQATVRWAAIRGMSQIGGEQAKPAVNFMIQVFQKGATEVEGYNMMIYLALLGPVAKDALPTIQSVRIKNPVLPSATTWAISPQQGFPWVGGFGGGRGGRGPGGPGGGGMADISAVIYQAYIRELGDRLAPATRTLANAIMDDTAGEVPAWGYELLTAAPEAALKILTPHLADADVVMRKRAASALGNMGISALEAKAKVAAALAKADTEKEQILLKWCLREIDPD